MTHTFEYHPIETAPKDRRIALLIEGRWIEVRWNSYHNSWQLYANGMEADWLDEAGYTEEPTHWAEIEAMKPGGAE